MDGILNGLFKEKKPVVLYVHGRGNEPRKTWKKGMIAALEKDYAVKVLMFNWDSKRPFLSSPYDRPVEKAKDSAPRLREVIARWAGFRESHPDSKAVPVSLLVHSMGNIVLRQAVNDGLSLTASDGLPLFTNILMTGSDEDAEGHHLWVNKLTCSGTNLLTINRNDRILAKSSHRDGKTPLGINPLTPHADHAHYLDATGLVGEVHRIFIKGRQHDQVALCHILTAMLRGEKPNLEVGPDIKEVNGRMLVPVDRQSKTDPCFQDVREESEEEEDE